MGDRLLAFNGAAHDREPDHCYCAAGRRLEQKGRAGVFRMVSHSEVLSDLAELRSELHSRGSPHRDLLELSPLRPLADIAVDWVIVLGCVAAVTWGSHWLAPLAVCVIANRQRALGNVLHDAGHRNLLRDEFQNDLIARVLVAPLLFASLTTYRRLHFKHHLALGDQVEDPDFLPIPDRLPLRWGECFIRNLCSWPVMRGAIAGHLASADASAASKLLIVVWWAGALGFAVLAAGQEFAMTLVVLWLLARATVFHLITTFREMCDHFGLLPGGIFSFTRDMACHGFWRRVIHPRNNGYHLTHHLLPAVPYYRLPQAHSLFSSLPAYQAKAQVCHSYFSGYRAVTQAWQAREHQ